MRLYCKCIILFLLTSQSAFAQDATPGFDEIGPYIMTSLLFVLGAFFIWVLIFGLFLLRIDGSAKREPRDNFATDVVAILGSVIAYTLTGFNTMFPGDFNGYFASGGVTVLDPVGVAAADAALDYASIGSDFTYMASFAAMVSALFALTISGRLTGIRLLVSSMILTGLAYPISTSWQWGGGWLSEMGFSDFAGATVCFLFVGLFSLITSIALGPRTANFDLRAGQVREPAAYRGFAAASTPLIAVGMAFGVCAASQLAAGTVGDISDVSRITANVMTCAGAAAVTAWMLSRWSAQRENMNLLSGEATVIAHGVLAGTFAIAGEPLAPSLIGSILIGALAVVAQRTIAWMLGRLRVDDPVSAISAGVGGGACGTIAVVFSSSDAVMSTQITGLTAIGLFAAVIGFLLHIDLFLRRPRSTTYKSQ